MNTEAHPCTPLYFLEQAEKLFGSGLDTVEIGHELGLFESQVERLLHIARHRRLYGDTTLPAPYREAF